MKIKLEFFKIEPDENDLGGEGDSIIFHQFKNDIDLDFLLNLIKKSKRFTIEGVEFVRQEM